tara:strand:+ start:10835 stop:11695 length:861 start_codon:yes stop_codon:yes gene_type:complete
MKNILKSIFISVFPAFALYILIDSILHLAEPGFSISNLGSTIISLSIVLFFAGLFLKPTARTSRNLMVFTSIITIGLIVNVFVGRIYKNQDLVGSSMSILLYLGWWLYIKWYSVFEKRDKNILKVGNQLSNFEVEDISKNNINSSSFIGRPAIYLFYRGNWCPLCMAQIKKIANQYKELEKRGVAMNFISPQPHQYSNSLAKKYQLGFNFLVDTNNKAAKQLGIFSKNGIPFGFQVMKYESDTVMPTVVITNSKGEIIFADLTDNYRVRPEPETFLKVLDAMKNNE